MKNNSDSQLIRILIENWAKAVQDRDGKSAMANHTNDIVMFDVPMPYQSRGIEAYEKTWKLFFSSNQGGGASFAIKELEIISGDTVAFCYGMVDIFKSTVRITIGLKKINGKWMIAHEHHSYPIEL